MVGQYEEDKVLIFEAHFVTLHLSIPCVTFHEHLSGNGGQVRLPNIKKGEVWVLYSRDTTNFRKGVRGHYQLCPPHSTYNLFLPPLYHWFVFDIRYKFLT